MNTKLCLLFVIVATAFGGSALAQNDVGQIKVKCAYGGVDGCTRTDPHEHSVGSTGTGTQNGDNSGQGTNSIDEIGGSSQQGGGVGTVPPTSGNNEVGTQGQGGNKPDPSQGNEETDEERAAREAKEQRERLEKARIDAKNTQLSDEARKAAAQEVLRSEKRFRIEMDRGFAKVRQAATSSARNLRKAMSVLEKWQQEMEKAGLTKEVVTWYVENQSAIEQLLTAYGSEEEQGPLRWLVDNKASVKELVDNKDEIIAAAGDHANIADHYADRTDSNGKSYKGFPLTYMVIENDRQNKDIDDLKKAVGIPILLWIMAVAGPVLAVAAFLLRKK